MAKLWKKIRKWIKDHDTEIIATLAAILIYTAWHEYRDSKTTELTAKHIESITATQTIEKEVKNNAGTVRQTQSDNDRRVRQAVKKAADDIPTDLAALVDMANTIIRSCNSNQ